MLALALWVFLICKKKDVQPTSIFTWKMDNQNRNKAENIDLAEKHPFPLGRQFYLHKRMVSKKD